MEFLEQEADQDIVILRLSRGKANAINAAVVDELNAAFAGLEKDDAAGGVVLASASPRFFSAGFDTVEVFAYDREEMRAFFGSFMDLYECMACFPKPVVAAVSGHAYAGGAILALACGERVFAKGAYGFALNEVHLGVVIPPGVMRMAIAAVGVNSARALGLAGRTFSPAQALDMGLAAELVDPEATLPAAVERARTLAQLPPQAYAAIKRMFAQETVFPEGSDRTALEPFLDYWFSDESLARKQALLDSMRSK